MFARSISVGTMLSVVAGLVVFIDYWTSTHPLAFRLPQANASVPADVPARNKQVIDFIESQGKALAPTYNEAVCTEFVIHVVEHFVPLTRAEKKAIRIITSEDLKQLIDRDAPVIKGVQTALAATGKGKPIAKFEDVRPGDFVQFWNVYNGSAYGHCGVVLCIDPNESITLYSSHPVTDGFGQHEFSWPDKVFFIRLQ